jgi:hypothetical protein
LRVQKVFVIGVPVSEIRSLTSLGNKQTIGFRIISSSEFFSLSVLYVIRRPRYCVCGGGDPNVKYKVRTVSYISCKGKLAYSKNNYVGPGTALE